MSEPEIIHEETFAARGIMPGNPPIEVCTSAYDGGEPLFLLRVGGKGIDYELSTQEAAALSAALDRAIQTHKARPHPMSEPELEYDTDTEPQRSSAPWDAEAPDESGRAHVWASDGDLVCSVTDAPIFGETALGRARLIAAAGTAAQEAKEMGYDPAAAVEALPELLNALIETVEEQPLYSQTAQNALARAEGSEDE